MYYQYLEAFVNNKHEMDLACLDKKFNLFNLS